MNFRQYLLISRLNSQDTLKIEVDIDTIDDDEPTINIIEETLVQCENGLCPQSQEFIDDWNDDDQFLQCCWDMVSNGQIVPIIERRKYNIHLVL